MKLYSTSQTTNGLIVQYRRLTSKEINLSISKLKRSHVRRERIVATAIVVISKQSKKLRLAKGALPAKLIRTTKFLQRIKKA